MAYTFDNLRHKTVAQLRDIAAGVNHDALQGYTQLNKDHLLKALCTALNIDMHDHHEVKGINKSEIKAQIRELKQKRDTALAAHDHEQLKAVRRRVHYLKRQIHKATV
jgi:hypothetical protein